MRFYAELEEFEQTAGDLLGNIANLAKYANRSILGVFETDGKEQLYYVEVANILTSIIESTADKYESSFTAKIGGDKQ